MNKNISVIMALGIVAVLAVGIAAISITQSVLAVRAARNVGWGTDGDSGGNGGSEATGGTATSGAATGDAATGNAAAWELGSMGVLRGTIGQHGNYLIINIDSNAVGCGQIGGSGSSGDKC